MPYLTITDLEYATKLQNLMKKEFFKKGTSRPYFYSSFWGDIFNDTDKIWRDIEDGLTG